MNHNDKSYKSLFIIGGIGSLTALITNVLDIVIGFGSSEVATYGTKSALDYFSIFQQGWFKGVYILGIFNIIYMTAMFPVYFALTVIHRKKQLVPACMATAIFLVALAVYFANNAAVPMSVLSSRFTTATTEAQRSIITAAAEGALARGEDFTPGSFIGLFLSGLAAITMSIVMLKGEVFRKTHAIIGIVGFTFLTTFTIFATFVPSFYMFSFYFFGSLGGVLALAWFGLTAYRLFRLGYK